VTNNGVLQNDPNHGLRGRLERDPDDPTTESVTVTQELVDLQEAVRERLAVQVDAKPRRRRSRR
jgi:hypothetical protein